MPLQTFDFSMPITGATKKKKPKVRTTSLGDGYEQREPIGLNHNLDTWNLSFDIDNAVGKSIDDFLEEHGGVTAFLWTPPKGSEKRFKCPEWDVVEHETYCLVKCTFVQVLN